MTGASRSHRDPFNQTTTVNLRKKSDCSKDGVDARGQWKSDKRMVDTCIDCVIPYPDAKVAATLSIGGPVKYATKTGYIITDKFTLNHVCSHIASLLRTQILLLLGRALLWAIYGEETSQQIEDWIKNRAKSAINITDGGNSIAKIPVFVSAKDGNLAKKTGADEKEVLQTIRQII